MTAEMSPMMLITLFSGILVFVFVMLLPALLELKRPKDAGPRRILEDVRGFMFHGQVPMLERTEERIGFDLSVLRKMAEIISVLPNLET